MNAEQALKIVERQSARQIPLVALLLEAVCVVTSAKNAEKMDGRGVEFNYIMRHNGDIVFIPNGNGE